ncbi:TnsA-like heteromeric transposase endonuclease subunit [Streptomyces sp. JV185]|uniref:TnsA-like heteromeric transposase endonuclease subunit n=1 Tax=Streptomyces sp. JV185 TaxID=858638 RepID=UPI002E77D765|nr:TnsA-like heteromeric transposase endonuclease subunit [Streptomyces sp. JV185]MEE1767074.1 TnsA-like heteromeric transposase endonuclease subunit [Streptomyces sp. JV185]
MQTDTGSEWEAVFVDPVGQVVQQRWADAVLAVAFEELEPVSAFPVVPGRRWGPGQWWSATTGRHVACGSAAMRAQLMVLDRDPEVVGLAGRPVRLLWRDARGQVRSWVPQLFARHRDGTAAGRLSQHPGRRRPAGAAGRDGPGGAQAGWGYRRLEPLEKTLAANLKWLAGYRHPRNAGCPRLAAAVREAFAQPRPLIEGAEAVATRSKSCPPSSTPCGTESYDRSGDAA